MFLFLFVFLAVVVVVVVVLVVVVVVVVVAAATKTLGETRKPARLACVAKTAAMVRALVVMIFFLSFVPLGGSVSKRRKKLQCGGFTYFLFAALLREIIRLVETTNWIGL